MKKYNHISRRKFIGQASCAALGYSSLLNTLVNLKALNSAAMGNSSVIGGNDYKALVCLFKSGGNDAFNMLIPRDPSSYSEYATTRTNLAIPQNEILPINPVTPIGQELGVHSAMTEVQRMFNERKLSFITNIGTLIEPTNKSAIYNDTANLPLGLFSHSDQIQQWQTAYPHERSQIGWGGKVADIVKSMNSNDKMSMNLSLSGTNIFQTGNGTTEYTLDNVTGSVGIDGYGEGNMYNVFDSMRTTAIDRMVEHHYGDAFKQTYVDVIRNSRDAHLEFQAALETLPDLQTDFDENEYLSSSFKMVARTMGVHQRLGFKRQIFFIDFGGWDHHDEVLNSQRDMLYAVDRSLGQFYRALEELGLQDCVTTFTISEFGRTLTSNGNGTDHAWGGNVMVMGGDQVNGGEIFGQYPSLGLGNALEIGNGVLIPTTAADEYFAELAMWFGVNGQELGTIFPHLSNFYSIGGGTPPLGFLNI